LYFNDRLEKARETFESALHAWMEVESPSGFHLLFRVFNSDRRPSSVHRVTLAHIYGALDRPLDRWTEWPRFVRRLGMPLLRAAQVGRDELQSDPRLVRKLFQRIDRIRNTRLWTGISRGEEDVVRSAQEVERSQLRFAQQRQSSEEALAGDRKKVREKMSMYFGVP